MRTFFAIKLPPGILQTILSDIAAMQQVVNISVKWVPQQQMHLTLKFLGDFNPHHLSALQAALNGSCRMENPLVLETTTLGTFPPRGLPRVIWYGFKENTQLAILAETLETVCAALGYARGSHAFTPHLTIGRVRQAVHQTDLDALSQSIKSYRPQQLPSFTIETLHFIHSTLTPGGPLYQDLFQIAL